MLLRSIFASTGVAACFEDAALLDAMLAFEAALARAQASCGLIPAQAAAGIEQACASMRFDVASLAGDARRAGTLAIPFVKALTAHAASGNSEAARYVHWGATSQDVTDSALALQSRKAAQIVLDDVDRLGEALARLVERYRSIPMVARTLLQPATPVPFGWKAATWLDGLTRTRAGFRDASAAFAVLQFGGASGVRAALHADGERVAEALARELDLAATALPWHSVRDRIARLGSELAILCGVASKMAGDVASMMQPELGEVSEPAGEGRGGSSALPHKRNPVGSMLAREAGLRAPGLVAQLMAGVAGEHERGLGQWQSQWWTLGDLFAAAGSAVASMVEVIEGLTVDPAAMQRNLDATRGFVYAEALAVAIAGTLGKAAAHARVEQLCRLAQRQGTTLGETLAADAQLSALVPEDRRAAIFDPASQFGSADAMIDRALDAWRNPGSQRRCLS